MVRVWERVTALDIAARVLVATDAPEVASAAREAGAEVVLTRADHPSGTDRVAEVAARPEFAGATAIVNVQGDEPFVSAAAIRGALAMVRDHAFPLGTVAARAAADILGRPDVVKVVTADDGRALYFSRAGIPFRREAAGGDEPGPDVAGNGAAAPPILQHIGVYAYAPAALARWVSLPEHPLERWERLEQLRPLAAGLAIGVAIVDEPPARGIDTEHDLEQANVHWAGFHSGLN